MTDRWTTEDIGRNLNLVPADAPPARARKAARDAVKRWRGKGHMFDVEIDETTSERRYLPDQIRAARATDRQGARTDLQRQSEENAR